MSDIVPFQPPKSSQTTFDLAPAAWTIAYKVADTDFVPKALRKRPEAVMACILAGHESGISPMQALRSIHIVDGRPAMSAELMRALVMRAGHDIWTEDGANSTRVTVKGCRSGSIRESSVTWTLDDAKRAGLLGKNNWKSYPMAMLEARATTALCRRLFPDVLAGISHSIEELNDGDGDVGDLAGVSTATAGPAERTTPDEGVTATVAATTEPPAADPPAAQPAAAKKRPPLPGKKKPEAEPVEVVDAEDDIVDAEIVEPAPASNVVEEPEPADAEQWPADDDPVVDTGDDGPKMSGPQMIAMRCNDLGMGNRDDKLAAVAMICGLDAVESANDLTPENVRKVLDYLARQTAPLTLDDVVSDFMDGDGAEGDGEAERRTAVTSAETWDADRWKQYLKSQKTNIVKALKMAREVGASKDPVVEISSLEDLVGSAIADEVAGLLGGAS